MVALRARMEQRYADWQDDLPEETVGADGQAKPGWRTFFAECPDPAFARVRPHFEIAEGASVWPGRQGAANDDAPEGAHVCRAFEDVAPSNVRVVVLGQDPYPSVAQATGRAFEDGAWNGGRPQGIAKSLKPLMLAALATQDGRAGLFRAGSWPEVRRLIRDGHLALPALDGYFDALAGQGVLFVNAAWTHTRTSDVGVHLTLWRPVLRHFLRKSARDAQAPLLFVLLGRKAQARFAASGAEAEARLAENWGNRVVRVDLPHPRDSEFFGQNP